MKLYVGNLPWSVDDSALKKLFASYGVEEASLIKDKYSGRSKGFGFVTISDEDSAKKAIEEMHQKEIEGRPLTVSEARPMVSRDDDRGRNNRRSNNRKPFEKKSKNDEDESEDSFDDEDEDDFEDDSSQDD